MSSLRGWFRGSSGKTSSSPSPAVSASPSTTAISGNETNPAEQEILDMEDAMEAADLILNDDIDGAESRLREGKDRSAFHQLGLSVATFMRSVLGFEKETMAEATSRLLECEARAMSDMKKAQKSTGQGWQPTSPTESTPTQLYPPGTEFALVHAETELMLAVVSVLHESLTEAIKGFYKLRRAFLALNAIMETEASLLKQRGPTAPLRTHHPSFSEDIMPGSFDDAEFMDLESDGGEQETGPRSVRAAAPNGSDLTVLQDATTNKKNVGENANGTNSEYPQRKQVQTVSDAEQAEKPASQPLDTNQRGPASAAVNGDVENGLDSKFFTNPVDIFIHSGANMCFGILMVLISMVPPAFSRLLSIIGFKGDRERGVQMLWQSTKFPNINGGMAGMVLLAYYNGLVGSSDILPADADIKELASPGEIVGYPRERCQSLLKHMRALYPDSMLWRLEEARVLATNRKTEEAIKSLTSGPMGRMRQITALSKFELALDAMCAMNWKLMRDTFIQCVELNNWSHALYYYNAGCAQLEMYRDAFHQASLLAADASRLAEKLEAEAALAKHKKLAENYLRKAPTLAGKKKFMARQMPFDAYVTRKLAKWEERAKTLKLDLADAIGVSPAQEMIHLWNGSKRMSTEMLEMALDCLQWERCTADSSVVEKFKAAPEESALRSLCQVSLLRSLGRLDDAQRVLKEEVLSVDRAVFKGPTSDDYIPAAGHYEAAVICWDEACNASPTSEALKQEKVNECQTYLEQVANWETFILDARIGMRVRTGLETILWLKKKKNWS